MEDQILRDGPGPSMNRACEACRSMKRCKRSNRRCIFAPPQRKTPRRRTDARVSELEKEIQAMRALLDKSHQRSDEISNLTNIPEHVSSRQSTEVKATGQQISAPQATTGFVPTRANLDTTLAARLDIIDRGLLSMETAAEFFDVFKTRFASKHHVLVFPKGYTIHQLRHEKPTLFLAIIATASGMACPELHSTLNTEVMQQYANLLWIGGEKSLHFVQAMTVTAVWYYPVGEWSRLRFYEYVHFASTMAMDIGLGEPEPQVKKSSSDVDDSFFMAQGVVLDDTSNAEGELKFERQRTLLVCYINCVCVALSLRRPNLLQFTPYMVDCVRSMENSPFTLPADIHLVAFVKLLNMAEEISSTYADSTRYTYHQNQAVDRIKSRLAHWWESYKHTGLDVSSEIMYKYVVVLLCEPCLHQYYSPSLFKAPYAMDPPERYLGDAPALPTASLVQFVASAQALCELFGSLHVTNIRSLPTHLFNRVMYALVNLVKTALLDNIAAAAGASCTYQNLSGAGVYLDLCCDKLVEAGGETEDYRVSSAFSKIAIRLRKWYRYQLQRKDMRDMSEDPPFSLYAAPDDHPALHDIAETPSPSIFASHDAAHAGQYPTPTDGESENLNFSMADITAGMTFGQEEWMTGLDGLNFDPAFDLETNFLATAQDDKTMSFGEENVFDPSRPFGGT